MREPVPAPLTTTRGTLVGAEPIEQIVTMENHDEAYHAWKKAGFRDRIVVHVDAHIDFRWMAERDPLELLELAKLSDLEPEAATTALWNFSGRPTASLTHIGNFLNPALREGIARSVYWVAPDGFFSSPAQRRRLEQKLHTLKRSRPQAVRNVTWAGRSLVAEIYGRRLTVCSLSDLPKLDEAVLLDIDTDFLVVNSLSPAYPYADPPTATPWIWPDQLVARLSERRLRTDFVTIAYSVDGGYTPLGYKYLGDDLARLLREPSPAQGQRQLMATKREAALCRGAGRIVEAISAWERALAANPSDAAIHYHLAQVLYEGGQLDRARAHYREAVTQDPSYQTAYNNLGPVYLNLGRLAQAEAEYRKALALDPDDGEAHRGFGDLCSRERRWEEANVHYLRAREMMPDDGLVRLGLGRLYARLRRWELAQEELRQAVVSEEYEAVAQYWLGYVCLKRRRWDDALVAYKAARRLRFGGIRLHLSLGRLYLRRRNFYQASRHYGKAIRWLPAFPLIALGRLRRRLREIASKPRRDGQLG